MKPKKNCFGNLFSTENQSLLRDELGIKDGENVLDAGCGGQPILWARYHLDKDPEIGKDRDGRKIPEWANIVKGDVCSVPFRDKSFDWVLCIHVLEHIATPDRACMELMRVAKRGFIETPWKGSELFGGYPSHRWLIHVENNKLVFEPRTYIEHPFENFLMAQAQRNPVFRNLCLDTIRNLTCVQFVWEDGFEFVIKDAHESDSFDYDNPDHASRSHASYALNLLRHGAPVETALFHAEYAMQINPNSKYVVHVAAIIYRILNKTHEASAMLDKLKNQWGDDDDVRVNFPLLNSNSPSQFKRLVCPGKADEQLLYE